MLRKAAEGRSVKGSSLHAGPDRTLCEAVKVKHGLCWRLQNVGDARAVGNLAEDPKTGNRSNLRKKCVAFRKAGREEPSKPFDHLTRNYRIWTFPCWVSALLSFTI